MRRVRRPCCGHGALGAEVLAARRVWVWVDLFAVRTERSALEHPLRRWVLGRAVCLHSIQLVRCADRAPPAPAMRCDLRRTQVVGRLGRCQADATGFACCGMQAALCVPLLQIANVDMVGGQEGSETWQRCEALLVLLTLPAFKLHLRLPAAYQGAPRPAVLRLPCGIDTPGPHQARPQGHM